MWGMHRGWGEAGGQIRPPTLRSCIYSDFRAVFRSSFNVSPIIKALELNITSCFIMLYHRTNQSKCKIGVIVEVTVRRQQGQIRARKTAKLDRPFT